MTLPGRGTAKEREAERERELAEWRARKIAEVSEVRDRVSKRRAEIARDPLRCTIEDTP